MINYDVQTAYKSMYIVENKINIQSLVVLTEIENDIKKEKLLKGNVKKALQVIKSSLNDTSISDISIMNIISAQLKTIEGELPESIIEKFYTIIEKL